MTVVAGEGETAKVGLGLLESVEYDETSQVRVQWWLMPWWTSQTSQTKRTLHLALLGQHLLASPEPR